MVKNSTVGSPYGEEGCFLKVMVMRDLTEKVADLKTKTEYVMRRHDLGDRNNNGVKFLSRSPINLEVFF